MAATFVINPASGGRQGAALGALLAARGARITRLSRLAEAVVEADGPLIACGGDGTAAAVLDALWRSGRDLPVGLVPLGTGNDLARCLGAVDPQAWIDTAPACPERRIDRWRLTGPGVDRAFFNYWSMGADASVASRVHAARHQHPWLFRARWLNQGLYGLVGLQETGSRLSGVAAAPAGSGALVATSIASYAAGCRLADDIRDDDGLIDLFSIPQGLVGMGLVLAGRRRARRLGRHAGLEITLRSPLPMQVDGEPFRGAAGTWRIEAAGSVRVLSPRLR